MKSQFPVQVKMQLVNTLCEVFYYKDPLFTFLSGMGIPQTILAEIEDLLLIQRASKKQVLNLLFDRLLLLPDNQGLEPIREMLQTLVNWSYFSDSTDPVSAKKSIEVLTRLVGEYDTETRISREEAERQREHRSRQRETADRVRNMEKLRDRYFDLVSSNNPQQRGHEFEELLHDVFEAEGLNPEGSFAMPGEQTDGAFELDGIHYLVEAKWVAEKIGPDKVSWLQTKVERRYRSTTGLMIAINEFTNEAIRTARDSKCIVLMNGDDLYHVLQPTVDLGLKELLRKKIAAFSRKGTPFITAREILGSGENQ